MGYMRHHAIIVTAFDERGAQEARKVAEAIFARGPDPHEVGPLLRSPVNDYWTFLVPPDGSKEGWDESAAGDENRAQFVEWLRLQADSSLLDWVAVQYGDDEGVTRIVGHSDEPPMPERPGSGGR